MNTRSHKHRILRLLHGRFHGSVQWRSAEERAWLGMVPLGREFGSRDYHRFEQLEGFAFDLFGDMALSQQWLSQPHPALGGRTPNDCTKNDHVLQTALDLMAQLKHRMGLGHLQDDAPLTDRQIAALRNDAAKHLPTGEVLHRDDLF